MALSILLKQALEKTVAEIKNLSTSERKKMLDQSENSSFALAINEAISFCEEASIDEIEKQEVNFELIINTANISEIGNLSQAAIHEVSNTIEIHGKQGDIFSQENYGMAA